MCLDLVKPKKKTNEFPINIEESMHKTLSDLNLGARPSVLDFLGAGDNKIRSFMPLLESSFPLPLVK